MRGAEYSSVLYSQRFRRAETLATVPRLWPCSQRLVACSRPESACCSQQVLNVTPRFLRSATKSWSCTAKAGAHDSITDRTILSLLSSATDRARRRNTFLIVKPETVLHWHRRRIVRRQQTSRCSQLHLACRHPRSQSDLPLASPCSRNFDTCGEPRSESNIGRS